MSSRSQTSTTLALLGLLAVSLALTTAPAFATTLETPATEAATSVTATGAILHGVLNPLVEAPTPGYQFTYNTNGSCTGGRATEAVAEAPEALVEGLAVSAQLNELEPSREYTFCVVASRTPEGEPTETASGAEEHFTTPGTPVVSGSEASSITRTSAVIGGEVNARGARTEYFVEYGVGEAHGALGSPTSVAVLEAEPAGPQKVGPVALQELRPGTTYSYRIAAVNEAGTTDGAEGSFTTAPAQPPGAVTGEALEVTQTAATIMGTVDTDGLPTRYVFAVGSEVQNGVPTYSTPSYGEAGPESTPQPERLTLANLLPDTTYHYRLVATNADGTSYGADHTFTTPSFASPLAAPSSPVLLAFTHPTAPAPPVSIVTTKTKPLTRAQKLAKALRACHAKRGRNRSGCEAAARKKYGPGRRLRK